MLHIKMHNFKSAVDKIIMKIEVVSQASILNGKKD